MRFSSRGLGIVQKRGTFADEIVLVDVSLRSRVSLHAADRRVRTHAPTLSNVGGSLVACAAAALASSSPAS